SPLAARPPTARPPPPPPFTSFTPPPPAPTATPFPYTTLFRSAYKAAHFTRLLIKEGAEVQIIMSTSALAFITPLTLATLSKKPRSEEHTSELQSRENLVCRLLLEKKKKERSGKLTQHIGDEKA